MKFHKALKQAQKIAKDVGYYIPLSLRGGVVVNVGSTKWEWCNEYLEQVRKRSFSIKDFLSNEWDIENY